MLRMFQMFQPLFVHGILWLRFVRLRESRHADLSPGRGPGVKHDVKLGFSEIPRVTGTRNSLYKSVQALPVILFVGDGIRIVTAMTPNGSLDNETIDPLQL